MFDHDSMQPSLQLFRARFPNFSRSWRSLRSSWNIDITKIHWILSLRCPWLEACDCDCRWAATSRARWQRWASAYLLGFLLKMVATAISDFQNVEIW